MAQLTFRPHNKYKSRTHGFRKRMSSAGGRKTLNRRRHKGRQRLSVSVPGKR